MLNKYSIQIVLLVTLILSLLAGAALASTAVPEFVGLTNKVGFAGEILSFVVQANDADNGALTYTAPVLTYNSYFYTNERRFTWSIPSTFKGTYKVTFCVKDDNHEIYKDVYIYVITKRAFGISLPDPSTMTTARKPNIKDGKLIYTAYSDKIYVQDIATKVTKEYGPYDKLALCDGPKVSKDLAVWSISDANGMYIHDFGTDVTSQVPMYGDYRNCTSVAADGNRVIYGASTSDWRTGIKYGIFLYEKGAAVSQVIANDEGWLPIVSADGNKAVWANTLTNKIRLYDFTTRELKDIPGGYFFNPNTITTPRISGKYVVWFGAGTVSGMFNLYLYDISKNVTSLLLKDVIWDDNQPPLAISGSLIVYGKFMTQETASRQLFAYDFLKDAEIWVTNPLGNIDDVVSTDGQNIIWSSFQPDSVSSPSYLWGETFVLPAYIKSVEPQYPSQGENITLNGSMFGNIQTDSYILLNNSVRVNVTSWSSDTVMCRLPDNVKPDTIKMITGNDPSNEVILSYGPHAELAGAVYGISQPNTNVYYKTVYSHDAGYESLGKCYVKFKDPDTNQQFTAYYDQQSRKMYCEGSTQGFVPGSGNGQDTINVGFTKLICSESAVYGTGKVLSINWVINFSNTFVGRKDVFIQATDVSNVSTGFVQKGSWYIGNDTVGPTGTITINNGATYCNSRNVKLQFTAKDNDGGSGVSRVVVYNDDPPYATGDFSPERDCVLPKGDGPKTLKAAFIDYAGNWSAGPHAQATIILDTTPPNNGSFWIRSTGSYPSYTDTKSRDVVFELSAADNLSGVVKFQVTLDQGKTYSEPMNYSPEVPYRLPMGYGQMTLGVRFIDGAGNLSANYWACIFLRCDPPKNCSVTINNGDEWTGSRDVTLHISAEDAGNGLATMCFSHDGGKTYSTPETYATIKNITLQESCIYVKISDYYGGFTVCMSQIGIDSDPPTFTSIIFTKGVTSSSMRTGDYAFIKNISVSFGIRDYASGLAKLSVSQDGVTWTVYDITSSNGDKITTLTKEINFTLGDADTTYYIYCKCEDILGNKTPAGKIQVVKDSTPPIGNIYNYDTAEYTSKPELKLRLYAYDPRAIDNSGSASVSAVRFSGDCINWTEYEPVNGAYEMYSDRNFTLSPGDGERKVYAMLKDGVGNESKPFSCMVKLDTTPPSGTVVINGGAKSTQENSVTLTLSAVDTMSGVSKMKISTDGVTYGTSQEYRDSASAAFTTDLGVKTIYVIFIDSLGNESKPSTDTILLEQPLVPNAPKNVECWLTGPNFVELKWTDASTNEVGFKIERKPASGTLPLTIVGTVNKNTCIFRDTTVAANTPYLYVVSAYNDAGASSSAAVSAVSGIYDPYAQLGETSPSNNTSDPGELVYITAVYGDNNMSGDLIDMRLSLGRNEDDSSAQCMYNPVNNKLVVFDLDDIEGDGDIVIDAGTPGSNRTANNGYLELDSSLTTVTKDPQHVTIRWAVRLLTPLMGKKNIYLSVTDTIGTCNAGYIPVGTWTINKVNENAEPEVVMSLADWYLNPYVRQNEFITYTATFYDPNGALDLTDCGIKIYSPNSDYGVTVSYDPLNNVINLNGTDEVVESFNNIRTQGRPKYVQNILATIDCDKTAVIVNVDSITMTVCVSFTKNFSGFKKITGYAMDTRNARSTENGWDITVLHQSVACDIDGDSKDEFIMNLATWTGLEIIKKDIKNSSIIHELSPDILIKANMEQPGKDNVVVDFGQGYGVCMRSIAGEWKTIHSLSPQSMISADVDSDSIDELVIDFGAFGVYIYFPNRPANEQWELIHKCSPRLMTKGDIDSDGKDEVIIDFGYSYGIYIYDHGKAYPWTLLHSISSDNIVTADSDSDGYDEITIDFGEQYGLWRVSLNTNLPSSKVWQYLHYVNPKLMETCDMDGDGRKEIVIDFQSVTSGIEYGIYDLDGRSGWSGNDLVLYWNSVHAAGASSITSGSYDRTSTGDELFIDFGSQAGRWINNFCETSANAPDWVYVCNWFHE